MNLSREYKFYGQVKFEWSINFACKCDREFRLRCAFEFLFFKKPDFPDIISTSISSKLKEQSFVCIIY